MKKLFITLACIITLAAALALPDFAVRTDNGVLVYDADRIEEILSCEAGERDIRWDVPFLANEPKMRWQSSSPHSPLSCISVWFSFHSYSKPPFAAQYSESSDRYAACCCYWNS